MIHQPSSSLHKRFTKSTYFQTQEGRFYEFLLNGWYTATQAERSLKLRISNITVFKRNLEKAGLLIVGAEIKCPVTGRPVNLITTNPELIAMTKLNLGVQTQLF